MKVLDVKRLALYLRKHDFPLVVAGDGCDRIVLDGTGLFEYAGRVATELKCPIAATGTTIVRLRNYQGIIVKKMWLAELFRFLEEGWRDPLLGRAPDLLVLIGYQPYVVEGLIASVRGIHTVHLGPGSVDTADRSLKETSLKEWKKSLDELVYVLASGG